MKILKPIDQAISAITDLLRYRYRHFLLAVLPVATIFILGFSNAAQSQQKDALQKFHNLEVKYRDSLYLHNPHISRSEVKELMKEFHRRHSQDLVSDVSVSSSRAEGPIQARSAFNTVPDSIEYLALKAIFESTGGPSWYNKNGWPYENWPDADTITSEHFSSWEGVGVHDGDISSLILTDNNLSGAISADIQDLAKIRWIGFSFNEITLPEEIQYLKTLKSLGISGTSHNTIPAYVCNIPNLTGLSVDFNDLHQLPDEIGNLTTLTSFSAEYNSLSSLPSTFSGMSTLANLSLTGNLFYQFPTQIVDQPITNLYMEDNRLTSLPPAIGDIDELEFLFLNGNQIQMLPDEIGNLENLSELYISHNALSSLPATFFNLPLLNFLDLGHNQFTAIPDEIGILPALWVLNIEYNQLKNLPESLVSAQYLQRLFVNNNLLESLPDLNQHANPSDMMINVASNKLDFEDLETFYNGEDNYDFKDFDYLPQADFGEPEEIYWLEGGTGTIAPETEGEHNIYKWQKEINGEWQYIENQTQKALQMASVTASDSGKYRLEVSNAWVKTLSIHSQPFTVFITSGVVPPIAQDERICAGNAATLNATGTGDVSWYNTAEDETPIATGLSFTTPVLDTTTVYYVGQEVNGTMSTLRKVTVFVDSLPSLIISANTEICSGESTQLMASGAASYNWDQGLGSGTTHNVSPLTTTPYTVTAVGANGCPTTGSVTVKVNPLPSPGIDPQNPVICIGGKVDLVATGGSSYRWSNSATTAAIEVNPNITTTYTVTAIDGNGCSMDTQTTVTVDGECPAAPDNLRAIVLSASKVELSWSNNASGIEGFKIERRPVGGSFSQIAIVGASNTTFTDTNGLQPGEKYEYRVKAYEGLKESSYSREVRDSTFTYDQHYRRETTVLIEGVMSPSVADSLGSGQALHTWSYLDGELRTIQQVTEQYSPAQNDFINPIAYDPIGRQEKQYLPYTLATPNTGSYRILALESEQAAYYDGTNTPSNISTTTAPFAQTDFEESPLSRPVAQGAPGESWQLSTNNTIKSEYQVNTTNEVLYWTDYDGSGPATANSYYQAGELRKSLLYDAQGGKSETFTDKSGRTILQKKQIAEGEWSYEYFLYDEYNNLSLQLTPEASKILLSQSGLPKIIDSDLLDKQCYQYKYDDHGRVISKKVPGKAEKYFVYDRWNRLVLTQNGKLRQNNYWYYLKYDQLNRAILTGLVSDTRTASEIQTALLNETVRFESRTDEPGNMYGYTNTAFPTLSSDVLQVTYYDDYSFISSQTLSGSFGYKNSALDGLPEQALKRTKGMSTGNRVRILDTNEWIWSVNYYDTDYQLIQTIHSDHLGGVNRRSYLYNFAGWPVKSRLRHFEDVPGKEITITQRSEYDHTGRLLKDFHQINDQDETEISGYLYNELGKLVEKNLHYNETSGEYLQSLDYHYNVRGWLETINNPERNNDGYYNDDDNDYFGEQLIYNEEPVSLLPNGSVSWTDLVGVAVESDNSLIKTAGWGTDNGGAASSEILAANTDGWIEFTVYRTGKERYIGLSGTNSDATNSIDYALKFNGNDKIIVQEFGQWKGAFDDIQDGDIIRIERIGTSILYKRNGTTFYPSSNPSTGPLLVDVCFYHSEGTMANVIASFAMHQLSFEPYYDGKVSTMLWGSALDTETARSYSYDYDKAGRLLSAKHHKKSTGWTPTEAYSVSNIKYDRNGNILALSRKDSIGTYLDSLQYNYDGNLLLEVTDQGNPSGGFKDGNVSGQDYAYDSNGNLAYDKNSGIDTIYYYFHNRPDSIVFSSGISIKYLYDAGGNKLSQRLYMQGEATPAASADYLGDFVYMNDTLRLIHHPEGRLVKSPDDTHWEYQYYLRDHLGSVRVTLTSEPRTTGMMATMETENAGLEEQQFLKLKETRTSTAQFIDHSKQSANPEVIRLNAGRGITEGPGTLLKVMPGDKVKMEVYVKYLDLRKADPSMTVASIVSMLATGGTGSMPGEAATGAMTTSSAPNSALAFMGSNDEQKAPEAFLNYHLFDNKFNPVDGGFIRVTEAAAITPQNLHADHEKLVLEVEVTQPGYLFTNLSQSGNDNVDVYFDDYTVIYEGGHVIQAQDYYPFGMPFNTRIRENEVLNKYLFQGKELQDSTGWYDFHARQYSASLGRFLSVDPQNQFASGFVGMGNNPVIAVDPDGEWIHIAIGAVVGGVINVAMNWDNIDSFGEGLASFGVGAAVGGATAACGGCGGAVAIAFAGGALTGGVNNIVAQTNDEVSLGEVNWGQVGIGAGVGGISGVAGYGAGTFATNHLGGVIINGTGLSANSAISTGINGLIGGAAGGYAGGFTGGYLLSGGDLQAGLDGGWNGLTTGAVIGAGTGLGMGYAQAKLNNYDPWTGKAKSPNQIGLEGEKASGLKKNTERLTSALDPNKQRIPDGLDHDNLILSEVKNVKRLSFNRQLRDYHQISLRLGYQFDLYIRPTTVISQPLHNQVLNGNINIKYLDL